MAKTNGHESFGRNWIWMAVLAVISIIGGIFALANPFAATLAAVLLAGWFFVLQGIIQIVYAFRIRGWTGFIWQLGLGILALVVGIMLVANPFAGSLSLTLLVAVLLLFTGGIKIAYAFRLRPLPGWVWVLVSGIVSVLLGGLILADYPASAATILGIFLGIELLSNGVLFLFIALGLRKLTANAG